MNIIIPTSYKLRLIHDFYNIADDKKKDYHNYAQIRLDEKCLVLTNGYIILKLPIQVNELTGPPHDYVVLVDKLADILEQEPGKEAVLSYNEHSGCWMYKGQELLIVDYAFPPVDSIIKGVIAERTFDLSEFRKAWTATGETQNMLIEYVEGSSIRMKANEHEIIMRSKYAVS
jgi:hypothetical protein